VTTVSTHEQRLGVRGENVVTAVASDQSDRLRCAKTGVGLVRAMADQRVLDLHFGHPKAKLVVRCVKL
jgi:hypothetical protein